MSTFTLACDNFVDGCSGAAPFVDVLVVATPARHGRGGEILYGDSMDYRTLGRTGVLRNNPY